MHSPTDDEATLLLIAMEQEPDERGLRLLMHHITMEEQLQAIEHIIQQYGGTIIALDDPCLIVVFSHVSSALDAAVTLMPPAGHGCIRNGRIAIHRGPLQFLSGQLVGLTRTVVRRLARAATNGQILLSAAAQQCLHRPLPSGLHVREIGCYPLIYPTREEPVFQLVASETTTTAPALRMRAPAAAVRPLPTTPLLGRANEIANLQQLLLQPHPLLLTLTGPGGIGKTRLALEVAHICADWFLDGVVFVELATIQDSRLVLPTISHALGHAAAGNSDILTHLIDKLHDQHMLLVLDNIEHLLSARLQLATLLNNTPFLKLLVTSREVLNLSHEAVIVVPPLEVLPLAQTMDVGKTATIPAVQLFVERAQRVEPTFQLTPENTLPVATICTRLDGLPLAIELAAARSALSSPTLLLDQLSQRLDVLTDGFGEFPTRHQTLRETIAWSYNLLTSAEQVLFQRLGVFVGGGSLEAAEAVCARWSGNSAPPSNTLDVLDGVESLLAKSLLQQAEDPTGEPRFVMLETIREYALEQLRAAGEEESTRTAHAAYYAAQAVALNTSAEQPSDWVPQVATEHPNRLAALEWALARHDSACALALCAGTYSFWMLRGMYRDGLAWCEAALLGGETAPPNLLLRVWQAAGVLAGLSQDHTKAEAYFQRALALARQQGDLTHTAWMLHNLGLTATFQQQFTRAKAYYTESLLVQRQLPRPFALTLHNLGHIILEEYDDAQVEKLLRQALELTQTSGDLRVRVWVLASLATLRLLTDNTTAAVLSLIEAFRSCRVLGGHEDTPSLLWLATACLEAHGNTMRATCLLAAAEALSPDAMRERPPRQRAYFTALRERIRAHSETTILATAWAEGGTLSRMAAVTVALEALEQIAIPDNIMGPYEQLCTDSIKR